MKNIKVYNLKEKIENEDFDGKKVTTYSFSKIAIMTGKKGVLCFNEEAIGYLKDNIDEEIEISLNDISTGNTICCMPQYEIKMSIKEIIETINFEEMELIEFIKRYNYNSRLRDNFSNILKSINKIGLKKKDYYMEIKESIL